MTGIWRYLYWSLGFDYPEHWCEKQRWLKYMTCQDIEKGAISAKKTVKKRKKRKGKKQKVSL